MKKLQDIAVVGKIRKLISVCGFPQMLLLRLFTAFFAVSAIMFSSLKHKNIDPLENAKDYMANVNFALLLLYCLIGVLVLTLVYLLLPKKLKAIDPFCTIFAVLYFNLIVFYDVNTHRITFDSTTVNMYAPIAVGLVSIVIVAFAVGKIKNSDLLEKGKWWIYGGVAFAAAFVMILYISITSVCHHNMFSTAAVDFGLFVQTFNSLADNLTAMNTCERDMLISHFNVHSSYIFYVLMPFFKIFPYEETLFVFQAIGAMGGIVPMVLILKKRNFKGIPMLCFSLAYVLSICLICPCFYDFHENAFLPTLLMWTLWAVDTKRYIPFYIFSALVCIVKEDAPLYIICIGLYMFYEHKGDKKRFHGLIAAFVATVYMLFITNYLVKNGYGESMTSSRFGHLMLEGDTGMVNVLINCLRNPVYFFSTFVTGATLPFLVQVMLPLLFMPFFTKKIHRFLLMIPFVISNLCVGAYYQYAGQISFQYIFGPGALLLYMAIANVDDMSENTRKRIPVIVFAASFIFFAGYGTSGLGYYKKYNNNKVYYSQIHDTLEKIPEDAVICGNTMYIAHLCDREQIYVFDKKDLTKDTQRMKDPDSYDFVIVDRRDTVFQDAVLAEGYTIWDSSGTVEIYKNPDYVE